MTNTVQLIWHIISFILTWTMSSNPIIWWSSFSRTGFFLSVFFHHLDNLLMIMHHSCELLLRSQNLVSCHLQLNDLLRWLLQHCLAIFCRTQTRTNQEHPETGIWFPTSVFEKNNCESSVTKSELCIRSYLQ